MCVCVCYFVLCGNLEYSVQVMWATLLVCMYAFVCVCVCVCVCVRVCVCGIL